MRALPIVCLLTGMLTSVAGIAQEATEGDSELRPLTEASAEFPEECIGSRMESHFVVVRYDVTVDGVVHNAEIVESSNECFNHSALAAVSELRFEPRRLGGVPVAVTGMRNKFSYSLAAMRDDVESELQAVEERLFNGDGAGALALLADFEAKHGRKLNRYEYASALWMRGVAHSLEKNYPAAGEDLRAALDTNDLYPETIEWIRSVLSNVEANGG